MKMKRALAIINDKPCGFMVHFERCGDGLLRGDYFPDKHAGEKLIPTQEEAWVLAEKFANKMKGRVVNIYIVNSNFSPVSTKQIKNR